MRKFLYPLLLVAFVLNVFWFNPVRAQERNGMITGRVADSSKALLPGAKIELQPKGQIVASDSQGQFAISNVAPGHYTLIVSYVGFTSFSSDVTVLSGQATNVDAVLQIGSQNEQITVRAERQRGEVEAINRERTADNILQVLPAEVITSLPNTNIADAVGRLPSVSLERDEGEGKYVQIRGTEPRLSNVTVDGMHVPSPEGVRNVKLDVIPSDLVESVEISKTLSANQEADAIGGSVNLVTKTAGDEPYLSVTGSGGYTPIAGGRSLHQFGSTFGNRFGKEKRLGVLFGGSYDWNGRGIDDIEPSVDTPAPTAFTAMDVREYQYDRHRFGFGGGLDYRIGAGSSAYLRGLFSQFRDHGQDWIYSTTLGDNMSFSQVTRKPEQQIFSVIAGARHDLGPAILNYEISTGQARQTGGYPSVGFTGPAPQLAVDDSHPFTPQFKVLDGTNIFDPNAYKLSTFSRADNHTFERDFSGAASLTRNYAAGSHFGAFEIGIKIRDANKSQIDNQQFYGINDGFNVPLSSVQGTFTNQDYYFGKYKLGPVSDYNKILAYFAANPGAFTRQLDQEHQRSDPNDFNAGERVYAGYVMNTISIAKLRLQAGLRFEGTQSSFLGNHVTLDADGHFVSTTPVTGNQSYTNALPSVQLQYALGGNTNLRAAYSMGIARPNFSDLPPYILQQDNQHRISVGNQALKPTHAHNFDLLFEQYLKPFGLIQVGGFYKALTDPIYTGTTTVTAGTFAGYQQRQPINGSSARIIGVEMTWQQHLSFLPGALRYAGVMANYSYTTSKATVPTRTDDPALVRQAPNNWNFDTTYDKGPFSGRIGLTHNDANIFAYNFQPGASGGIKGPNGDVYLYPHTQVDAQVSYWIPQAHGVQAVVSLLNLTNEVFGFYQGSEQFPIQREYYNRTVSVGLRWTPFSKEPK